MTCETPCHSDSAPLHLSSSLRRQDGPSAFGCSHGTDELRHFAAFRNFTPTGANGIEHRKQRRWTPAFAGATNSWGASARLRRKVSGSSIRSKRCDQETGAGRSPVTVFDIRCRANCLIRTFQINPENCWAWALQKSKRRWVDAPLLRLALRAIRVANVRFDILSSQSACAGRTSGGVCALGLPWRFARPSTQGESCDQETAPGGRGLS